MAIDSVTVTAATATASQAALPAFNQEDGPSFSDVLDILNPLQHIPVINSIYQHLTGDSEGAVADVAGGTLWTGPIGLVASLVDLSMRSEGGKSASDRLLSWLGLDDADSGTAVAAEQAQPANPASPAAQAAQQTAAAAAPALLPTALTPPPRSRGKDADPRNDRDGGPQKRGDFLVFGAAGSSQPAALSNVSPLPQAAPVALSTPQKHGDFLVFGGAPAKAGPVPQQLAGGAPAAAPLAPPAPPTPPGLTPLPARSFAAPARRTQVTPTALPPPTTGPAAIPGHGPSQALQANSDADWILGAIANNLDKYQAAQKLGDDRGGDDGATLH